ncbi:hypothetical protein C8A05DRAFT_15254 [Staphylotrichum tortipilum]|uniref:Uncharacterized protein n=1 Tax=Staphylotrichum tortipilum TaxID=2831512 RepID=A0AAN6RTS2_9PEZI|nr:hypothetical protein C8A05DRAFT_15254 [Staphylotrichum longicolle]
METVFCECKKCDAPIGRFVNLWTQIGKSYFSPVVEPEDDLAVRWQGAARIGEPGTLVQECHLQDIICGSCPALLGLRCIQTPVNHVLDENQILLRLASVELLDNDGREIEFAIKRVLSVDEPSRVSTKAESPDPTRGAPFTSAFPGAAEIRQLQGHLHDQREDIRRIDSNGFRIVSALDRRAGRIEGEVAKLQATVGTMTRDFGGLQKELVSLRSEVTKAVASAQNPAALAALDARLDSMAATLAAAGQQLTALSTRFDKDTAELRLELAQIHQDMDGLRAVAGHGVSAADHAQDMAALRVEMAQMRRQVDEVRSQGTGRVETAFPSRELEVLTSSIAKIGNRASQVESLQMELEMLKGRIERAEANKQATDGRRLSRPVDSDPPGYSDVFPGTQKRAARSGFEPAPKRPKSSLSHSNLSSAGGYAVSPARNALGPRAANLEDDVLEHDNTPRAISSVKKRRSARDGTANTPHGVSTRLRSR